MFAKIRGPIGSGRSDAYALMQASFSARTPGAAAKDFMFWLADASTESDDADDGVYVPSAEERAWAAAMA